MVTTASDHQPWRGAAVVAVAVLALTAACGLPDGGPAERVPAKDVPYGLLVSPTASPTPSTTTSTGPTSATGTIYLVDSAQHLVALPVQLGRTTLIPLVQSLLNRLAVGPSERERARGLLTDFAPGGSLTLRGVKDGTAVIGLRTATQDPSPDKLPVAIGQVVLTATSVVGVDQVLFVLDDGSPLSVPVPPEGDLSSNPLLPTDYQLLLAPGQGVPARAMPIQGTARLPDVVPKAPPSS